MFFRADLGGPFKRRLGVATDNTAAGVVASLDAVPFRVVRCVFLVVREPLKVKQRLCAALVRAEEDDVLDTEGLVSPLSFI